MHTKTLRTALLVPLNYIEQLLHLILEVNAAILSGKCLEPIQVTHTTFPTPST